LTEDERRNRNPKPEVSRVTREEIEAMPAVPADRLERHRVYVLQSPRNIAKFNYLGKTHAIHPVTLDTVTVHHFHAPRVGLDVFLAAVGDRQYTDADGTKIVARLWTGEDA
jgi:hypothetical protein